MNWINLGNIKANQEWRVTSSFKGNLIKIEQSISTLQISKNASTKLGLIGLLIEDQFFSIQQFFSEPKEQIFYFQYLGFDSCQIAIRDLSRYSSKDNWGINCYYWDSLIIDPINNIQEKLLTFLDQHNNYWNSNCFGNDLLIGN